MLSGAHGGTAKTAYGEIRRVAGTAVDAVRIRDVRRRQHRRLGVVVVVVEGELSRGAAVTLATVDADAGVQDRNTGKCRVARQGRTDGGMARRAGLVAGVRHMARRHQVAGPVGGGVAAGAIAARLLPTIGDVIGRAPLQVQRCAGIESQAGLVAGVAGGRDEGMFGSVHGGAPEAAGREVGSGVTGAAVGSR